MEFLETYNQLKSCYNQCGSLFPSSRGNTIKLIDVFECENLTTRGQIPSRLFHRTTAPLENNARIAILLNSITRGLQSEINWANSLVVLR